MPQSTALPATPSRRQGASVNPAEPRAARTHEALTTALFDLLRQRDLTEISISELCRTAGVHRTTFYGHYADIFAFAADSFAHILDELGSVGEGTYDGYSPEAVTEVYAESIHRELGHIVEHRAAYRMMFGTRVDAGFRRELYQRALRRASLAIAVWQRHGYGVGIDTATGAAYIAGGSVGVLEDWAFSDDLDVDARTGAVMASWPAWCAAAAPTAALVEHAG